ncbi:hypothetical protein [Methylobacterium sp. NEAU K]|uniref:hypothetical protein n=1 Tax=Methylobacterium sp. NEAU K TaxID=3064946 RepID=UPI0027330BE1|nr:hypothetical protein [Methylobacterium sp. NEAU K]MDP4005486.1 hypothetical protein [Methylobacterium sp. NEAU K]
MPMKTVALILALLVPMPAAAQPAAGGSPDATTVRTETFARPPYSGATYYIYERAGAAICTKLSVCNKFDACETKYVRGAYKDPEDVEAGEPAQATPAVAIRPGSLAKHLCLTRYDLAGHP